MAAGEMIAAWWLTLPTKFPSVALDTFVVMPNHIHGILWLTANSSVGADPRVRLAGTSDPSGIADQSEVGADPRVRLGRPSDAVGANDMWIGRPEQGGHVGPPLPDIVLPHPEQMPEQKAIASVALPQVVQWFKTMTTNAYTRGVKQLRWPPYSGKLWQRNYYERIIRNERELDAIRAYITANPARWADDPENTTRER